MITKELNGYVEAIAKEMSDIKSRLEQGADADSLNKLQKTLGCQLPEEIKELYSTFNGENEDIMTGFIAGFRFLNVSASNSELNYLKTYDAPLETTSKFIKEANVNELTWLPFAFDDNRSYIAVDLTPNEGGKKGQVLYIDTDYEKVYLLADSLGEFFEKMTKWFEEEVLVIDDMGDGPFISENSGHLGNNIESYAIM